MSENIKIAFPIALLEKEVESVLEGFLANSLPYFKVEYRTSVLKKMGDLWDKSSHGKPKIKGYSINGCFLGNFGLEFQCYIFGKDRYRDIELSVRRQDFLGDDLDFQKYLDKVKILGKNLEEYLTQKFSSIQTPSRF